MTPTHVKNPPAGWSLASRPKVQQSLEMMASNDGDDGDDGDDGGDSGDDGGKGRVLVSKVPRLSQPRLTIGQVAKDDQDDFSWQEIWIGSRRKGR